MSQISKNNKEKFEKHACENCKYYLAHYVVSGTSFHKIFAGHCTCNERVKKRKKDKYALQENCSFWESDKNREEEKIEEVKEVLRNMERHLHDIKIILKDKL